ncbi:MAG: hypothetical protein FJX44_10605 [Alphaproteobacteria bacterium]|nr:hypothetical protein [Alphaproteobacteria bacterium]
MTEADLDQNNVGIFLGNPETYGLAPPQAIDRIETHASLVFLAGPYAYKIKHAVKYPFLDFSTLEQRHAALRNELRINRRTAPQLYLEVLPITAGKDGAFHLSGTGAPAATVIEWALKMRRFPQENLYEQRADCGLLSGNEMRQLANTIAAFHAVADRLLTPAHAVLSLAEVLRDNRAAFAARPEIFPPGEAEALAQASDAKLASLSPLLRARARGGFVRHCHGDLHLRNIVEIEGQPVLFDALEFDDRLATIDVLYDLAFLLMDLGKRGLRDHANIVLNAYLDRDGGSGNLLGLAALPLFLSMRAAVRAKVELLRAGKISPDKQDEARREAAAYFALARKFLVAGPPRLVAIGGLSGSGKSAIARALAARIGAFPGAVHVRSDVERKRLFGVPPEARLPAHAYAPEISDQVYAMCRKRARLALEAGHSVIVDAVHAKPSERAAIRALAAGTGAAFTGLWLDAPPETMRKRVAARAGDVSDATPEVVEAQLAYDLGKMDFAMIDTSGTVDDVAAACLTRIGTNPLVPAKAGTQDDEAGR